MIWKYILGDKSYDKTDDNEQWKIHRSHEITSKLMSFHNIKRLMLTSIVIMLKHVKVGTDEKRP